MSVPPTSPSLESRKIVDLLKDVTTLRIVSDALKAKDFTHSASGWDDFLEKRLKPIIDSGELSATELSGLLGEVEECTRSHVFFYACDPRQAARLLEATGVADKARTLGIFGLLSKPILAATPDTPKITAIRSTSTSLSVKVVETRETIEKISESEGWPRTIVYDKRKSRAVNSVKLSAQGLLEIRVQSHSEHDYDGDIQRLMDTRMKTFFPFEQFRPAFLTSARKHLWDNHATLANEIRFGPAKARDSQGFTIAAGVPKLTSDLAQHRVAFNALDGFIAAGATSESSSIFWKKQENGVLGDDVHVLFPTRPNELIFTSAPTKSEYEHVISHLARLGIKAAE